MRIISTNLKDINKTQQNIVIYISDWARREKVPIPRKEIITHMQGLGVKDFTTVNAIRSLCKKGYIRPSVNISNSTSYVLLRTL